MVQLPVEVRHMVAEHLSRPSDFKNLCLTNKDWYDPGVKLLYADMHLLIGSREDCDLVYTFNPRNVALRYIQELEISTIDEAPALLVECTLRIILEYLPEDVLRRFTWSEVAPPSVNAIRKLYSTQRRLGNLQVMPTIPLTTAVSSHYGVEEVAPAYGKTLDGRQKLELIIDSETSFQLSQYLVQAASSIRTLDIEVRDAANKFGFLGLDSQTSSTSLSSVFARRLFSIRLPSGIPSNLIDLHELRLCSVDLRNVASEWMSMLDLSRLQTLTLVDCSGTAGLLRRMCRPAPVTIEQLTVTHNDLNDNRVIEALEALLTLCTKLKVLSLSLRGTSRSINAGKICASGSKLELLSVHFFGDARTNNVEWYWSKDDLAAVIDACPALGQLSCAFPPADLLSTVEPSWSSRVVSSPLNPVQSPNSSLQHSSICCRTPPSMHCALVPGQR
ncbi:hypothetical protein BDZ85DRAFT_6377 [Elsinoe ampelina]|uniref:Uncharacterized protein n=1 Tax=Elsinoe ampelina TaxID=302913 RepID=A0A6A6GPN6_9PEZI|nr:hypothetical protein BDZ85DRAFT_6377 [Elsinoe ampelina]